MELEIDGLKVWFPYEKMYTEQYEYMKNLKQALDAKGHVMLESPTGTGKTVSLLSLITAYQAAHGEKVGKLIFATRTVNEIRNCMEELKKVITFRRKCIRRAAAASDKAPKKSSYSSTADGWCLPLCAKEYVYS